MGRNAFEEGFHKHRLFAYNNKTSLNIYPINLNQEIIFLNQELIF
jgi:hypothetical protein